VLGAIFSLPGVQRVRGSSGKLDRFTQSFEGKTQQFYIDNVGKVTPYPARLDVQVSHISRLVCHSVLMIMDSTPLDSRTRMIAYSLLCYVNLSLVAVS
jgi:hypothetical protein